MMLYIPRRIQRRRTKGWRMPPRTLNCARPSKYSNPYRISDTMTRQQAIDAFEEDLLAGRLPYDIPELRRELRRYEFVACWCRLDEPCHVDLLIDYAGACDWQRVCNFGGGEPYGALRCFPITFSDGESGEVLSEYIICIDCWYKWLGNAFGTIPTQMRADAREQEEMVQEALRTGVNPLHIRGDT